ncbi:MAG: hypothetical protein RMN53_16370 [Anaerolineae bacterium]|nr:hypothetical protein [Anaerolineae bacterium]
MKRDALALEVFRNVVTLNHEEVRRQMRIRDLPPPVIRGASLGPDTIMLGAASLLVDAFLRKPPIAMP